MQIIQSIYETPMGRQMAVELVKIVGGGSGGGGESHTRSRSRSRRSFISPAIFLPSS
jgi:hypothetical protein